MSQVGNPTSEPPPKLDRELIEQLMPQWEPVIGPRNPSQSRVDYNLPLSPDGSVAGGLPGAVSGLLRQSRGLFIGETHGDVEIPVAVAGLIDELARNGVETLFIEYVHSDQQHVLDAYSSGQIGRAELEQLLAENGWDYGNDGVWLGKVVDVIDAALAAGIRVAGIDTNQFETAAARDQHWVSIINQSLASQAGAGKFAIYGGAQHGARDPDGRSTGSLLDIPMLRFEEGTSPIDQRDVYLEENWRQADYTVR